MPALPESRPADGGSLGDRGVASTANRPSAARKRVSGPRQSTGAFSASCRLALNEAAERAGHLLAETAGKTPEEVRAQLAAVIDVLPKFVTPGDADAVEDGHVTVPRPYFDALRLELVSVLAAQPSPPDGREVVTVFKALEEVAHRSELTSTGRFVARLSGADSVNAVVEIAHDLRSPLSSILFLVDTVRRGQSGKVSPIQERQLGLVYGAALGLSSLASDLIDAVRGERLVDGRPVPFSITEAILGVCAIVQPISEEKGLPLNVTYPTVDGRVGYPSAISRVLLNLTTNALRYTDSGSVSIGCVERSESTVEFWVEDTGHGIPDGVLAMLFDGFRPGSVGIRFSSAGLGLAISRTLLEAMGSSLNVETSPVHGTRFSFQLELQPA